MIPYQPEINTDADIVERLQGGPLSRQLAEEASDYIELLRDLMEWRPIETAPKDGRNVLLHSRKFQGVRRAPMQVGRWHQPSNPKCFGFWTPMRNPKHWMPLPPPPVNE
jgi:hypothetical protein